MGTFKESVSCKFLKQSAVVLLFIGALSIVYGCRNNNSDVDSEKTGSVVKTDNPLKIKLLKYSVKYPNLNLVADEKKSGNIDYHYACKYDFPLSQESPCADSIRYYFEKTLFEISSDYLDYKGDASKYQLKNYYQNPEAYIENVVKAMAQTSMNQWSNGVDRILWMLRKYEDDNYTSYLYQDYIVVGTYVGEQFDRGFTFEKTTGRLLGWNILKTKELSSIYKDGLLSFFTTLYNRVYTESELESLLLKQSNVAIDNIPPPSMPPYLSSEGLVFTYKPNELVSEMYGIPYFIIPLESLKDYLNISL